MNTRAAALLGWVVPFSIGGCVLWGERDLPCEVLRNCTPPPDAGTDAVMAPRDGGGEEGARNDVMADVPIDEGGESPDRGPAEASGADAGQPRDSSPDVATVDREECDASRSPADAACSIADQYGVFVSPAGAASGTGDGTKDKPFASISAALQRAKAEGKRVYVCDNGTGYTEALAIGAALDGAQVWGGFECDTWTYSTTRQAKLTALSSPVVTVTKASRGVVLADFEILAPDATTPGGSSIGVVVHESDAVVFHRLRIRAGKARDGSDGENGGAGIAAAPNGAPGYNGVDACSADPRGGATAITMCDGAEVSHGGGGGQGGTGLLGDGWNGANGTPSSSIGKGGVGEPIDDAAAWGCGKGGRGQDGDDGVSGTGGPGGKGTGTLAISGWTGNAGNDGASGRPGQGGGGGGGARAPQQPNACAAMDGGSAVSTGASGGGGGGGGCPGNRGKGGMAGGSSIALISIDSALTLDACELVASDAGKGGRGGNGQYGGNGGLPGVGGSGAAGSNPGCDGGKGGKGGNGGAGGGGQGGHSVGVAFRGTAPKGLELMTPQVGSKGAGGLPGVGIAGKGDDGLAVGSLSFGPIDGGS